MIVGLHSQTFKNPTSNIAGSEITTNGLAIALAKTDKVVSVYRFAPGKYDGLEEANLSLLIIEGWHATLNGFIQKARKANPNVVVLFWNLSFLGFNQVVKLDVDGYLSNSKKVSALLKQIKPTEFVMLAADINNFKPVSTIEEYAHDVTYLGLCHQSKSSEILDLVLGEASSFELAIYGSGWDDHPFLTRHWKGKLPQDDIAKLYSSSKVVLGTTEDRQRKAGMINNRVFEALACGACFISEHSVELERTFGHAIFYSKEMGGTRNHIKKILENYDEYAEHKSSVRKFICDNHTYNHRVKQILHFYQSIKNG